MFILFLFMQFILCVYTFFLSLELVKKEWMVAKWTLWRAFFNGTRKEIVKPPADHWNIRAWNFVWQLKELSKLWYSFYFCLPLKYKIIVLLVFFIKVSHISKNNTADSQQDYIKSAVQGLFFNPIYNAVILKNCDFGKSENVDMCSAILSMHIIGFFIR